AASAQGPDPNDRILARAGEPGSVRRHVERPHRALSALEFADELGGRKIPNRDAPVIAAAEQLRAVLVERERRGAAWLIELGERFPPGGFAQHNLSGGFAGGEDLAIAAESNFPRRRVGRPLRGERRVKQWPSADRRRPRRSAGVKQHAQCG